MDTISFYRGSAGPHGTPLNTPHVKVEKCCNPW